MTSTRSSNTDQLSTPVTADSHHGSTTTPVTSNESRGTRQPTPGIRSNIAYHDDFGLETLMTLVDAAGRSARHAVRMQRQNALAASQQTRADEMMFGRSLYDLDLEPRVRSRFEPHMQKLDDLESVSNGYRGGSLG